ncbi:MAG: hypothetical protein CVT92_12915 [Bacteroidetes bacterium HGW-Bacteroidetes-1]|jgi:uncharacterized protein with FMN-binding domain|nr:MAG: hypothetical protein CVT92_12915 [Bacteroidetes bacterium HGW-Bacteroidetes-1]
MMMKKKYRDLIIVSGIAVMIILAAVYGKRRDAETQKELIEAFFPSSQYHIERVNGNKWKLSSSNLLYSGNIYIGEGKGYNGAVSIMVQTDHQGRISQLNIIANHETPSYFQKLKINNFLKTASQVKIGDYVSGEPIDAVSGATITSRAIMQGIRNGNTKGENIAVSNSFHPSFGILEFIIVALLIAGLILQVIKNRKIRRTIRWTSLIVSFAMLGFVYNQPITLSRIVAILNGHFPDIRYEFYFYLLLGGSIMAIIFTKKNIYCRSICPFSAAQEILAKTGRAKTFHTKYYRRLKYLQWGFTLGAILLALVLNNPGAAQYEVFGAFFQLTGTVILFVVLFIVVILSLFIYRPWCNFMCPMDGVFAYVRMIRNMISK